MATQQLSSRWDGLNPVLLARFGAVGYDGAAVAGQPVVLAPLTEGSVEFAANWQSPFEHSEVENKLPMMSAMIQSGAFQKVAETTIGDVRGGSFLAKLNESAANFAQAGQGSNGMTRLNSMQLFSGSPPVKVTVTAKFRAFSNPQEEVEDPIAQLVRWSLSQSLADIGGIANAIASLRAGADLIKMLYPSKAPTLVSLTYRNTHLNPMVLESVVTPLVGPTDAKGNLTHASVQITMASLAALQAGDWDLVRSGRPIPLWSSSTAAQ